MIKYCLRIDVNQKLTHPSLVVGFPVPQESSPAKNEHTISAQTKKGTVAAVKS